MKKFSLLCWLITVMLISIASSSIISEQKKITATASGLSLPEDSFVTFRQETDLNSDGKNETVYVYGEKKREEDTYVENVNIAVVTHDGLLRRTNCKNFSGTEQNVYISDFNSDGKKDVLVILNDGENETCMIGDFAHSIPKNIMSVKDLKGLQMKLKFTDGFAVSSELENGQLFSVNVSAHKEILCKNGFYEKDGKLIKGTPALSKITEIKPLEHNFGSNLMFSQKLYVKEDNTYLCTIQAEMEYTGDTLLIKRIEYFKE